MTRRPGMSLTETVVALGLAALLLPLMLELLPSSALMIQRAEDVQTATGIALEELQALRASPESGEAVVVRNDTRFAVTRTVHLLEEGVWDLVVQVQGPRGAPVTVATRMLKDP